MTKDRLPVRRPRLALHVAARRHVARGSVRVVLHDMHHDREALVGEREWSVLRCADGTRDLTGIVAAARRLDRHIRPDHLEGFLVKLWREGMLAEGVEPGPGDLAFTPLSGGSPAVTAEEMAARHRARRARPLDPLPGYRFTCHGRGACCDIFPTVLFSPAEALRARAIRPDILEGDQREDLAFTPERGGSVEGPAGSRGVRAVTKVDGRCAYRDEDLRCRIHAAGRGEDKPLGCRLFPAVLVDDGEAIRVTVAPHCACVFDSLDEPEGEPLVPAGVRTGADLDPAIHVGELPEQIHLTSSRRVPRTELVAWIRHLVWFAGQRRLGDVARSLWALAGAIEAHGTAVVASERALGDPPPIDPERLVDGIWSLPAWSERQAAMFDAWRASADVMRLTMRWISRASALMLDDQRSWSEPPSDRVSRAEALYLAASLHGYMLLEQRTLADALRDRAVLLLLSRAVPRVARSEEVPRPLADSLSQPIALVDPVMRGRCLGPEAREP